MKYFWGPSCHSNYPTTDGYVLSCDENDLDFRHSNCRDSLAAILRVFDVSEFSTSWDTVEVADAFEVIWIDSEPYLDVCTDVDSMDYNNWPAHTPCPANFDCEDEGNPNAYMDLGIHDVTIVGRLAFVAYHGLGTHVLDISDPSDLVYRGGIAHDLAPGDTWNNDAYAICIAKDGHIYQSGKGGGFYIYKYGQTGTIASDTTWSGDVYVYDTLVVDSNTKLTLSSSIY